MPPAHELKRQIIEKGVRAMLEEAQVPQRYHLQVVRQLNERIQAHEKTLSERAEEQERHADHLDAFDSLMADHRRQIAEWDAEARRLTTIEHLEGKPGRDAEPVDIEQVVAMLVPYIPAPVPGKPGRDGKPGKHAVVDHDAILDLLIERIKKDKPIDISHIRNAEQFMFNGKKYKIEELMRGGGGTNTGAGITIETPGGVVNASNTVFMPIAEPLYVVADGIQYFDGAGYAWDGTNITMDIPPSGWIRDAISS